MQGVVLAAGRGSRMKELTETLPKPLLEVANKPLLEYEFDAMPDEVDEVIVIVGYLGGVILERYGGMYKGKRILYIEQDVLDGTAGALWRAKDILKDRFMVLMADDIYAKEDAMRCVRQSDWVMLVQKTDHMTAGGCVVTDTKGNILNIEEGTHGGKPGMISTNMFVLDTRLFEYPMVPKAEGSLEYGLPQTILAASKSSGIPFSIEEATRWIQISGPEDLKKAEEILSQ